VAAFYSVEGKHFAFIFFLTVQTCITYCWVSFSCTCNNYADENKNVTKKLHDK